MTKLLRYQTGSSGEKREVSRDVTSSASSRGCRHSCLTTFSSHAGEGREKLTSARFTQIRSTPIQFTRRLTSIPDRLPSLRLLICGGCEVPSMNLIGRPSRRPVLLNRNNLASRTSTPIFIGTPHYRFNCNSIRRQEVLQ